MPRKPKSERSQKRQIRWWKEQLGAYSLADIPPPLVAQYRDKLVEGDLVKGERSLVEPHKEALFSKAIEMVLAGNESMLRLFLERMLPAKPSDEPIHIDMPNTSDFNNTKTISQFGLESLRAVIAGKITSDEAKKIYELAGIHYKMFDLIEIMEEMRQMKEKDTRKSLSSTPENRV